jgi:seryl-tRNA synthetase
MLSLQTLREQPEQAIQNLERKYLANARQRVEALLLLDQQRRSTILVLEQNQAEMNRLAKEIGQAMAQKNAALADTLKTQTADLKATISTAEDELKSIEAQLHELLIQLPNFPQDDVPVGRTADDNTVLFEKNARPTLFPGKLPHWELAKKHRLIDFELGNKITGAGFPVYIGKGARLQRALIQFFLDSAVAAGYLEHQVPHLVNAASGFGTGQLPDKEGQMYHATEDDLYLIPTAEVPLTNIYRDVVLQEDELPVRICGYTPCFRREAGSYGAEVRGLNRLHQFDKVEIVEITTPEASNARHEVMLQHVCSLLDALELPYRALLLCTGDMSFASAKTVDLEVYSGGQDKWLEVSSVSNFESFQAERLKLRYKATNDKKNRPAHTLNGSALALPRIVAALLENNQQPDCSIRLPKALHSYAGFEVIG